jgi:mannose-6-phosphate isomerase-like protein (cupin superfamily)
MELIKENEKGTSYQADKFKILYRKIWSVSWDNKENKKEIIYLIAGSAEITIEEDIQTILAPHKIEIPANTYHKILALTDISLILFT